MSGMMEIWVAERKHFYPFYPGMAIPSSVTHDSNAP
jgi:hypothetical protein